MSWLPTAASTTGTVLSMIGAGIEAKGQIQAAKAQNQTQEYNAKVDEEQARLTRERAKLSEYQKRKVIKTTIGEQVAGYRKAGVTMSGSPLDVMMESLSNAELDISIDKFNAEAEARGYESQAQLRRYYGSQELALGYTRAAKTLLNASVESIYKFTPIKKAG